ncbi:hypothetical protein BJX68DRAFT_223106 [Aspergillus pseudodeflectus]|uniref:Uncharacterized protein n=1 Tax=Aspergillus pseudodeflectus TaxID=176178 RepID=A0ABR4LB01_9EURO
MGRLPARANGGWSSYSTPTPRGDQIGLVSGLGRWASESPRITTIIVLLVFVFRLLTQGMQPLLCDFAHQYSSVACGKFRFYPELARSGLRFLSRFGSTRGLGPFPNFLNQVAFVGPDSIEDNTK